MGILKRSAFPRELPKFAEKKSQGIRDVAAGRRVAGAQQLVRGFLGPFQRFRHGIPYPIAETGEKCACLADLDGCVLKVGLLADRIPAADRQLICRATIAIALVPISVVEGNENVPWCDIPYLRRPSHRAASGRDLHLIALPDAESIRVLLGDLHEHFGSRPLKLWGSTGLCSRMEVVHDPAGGQEEGVIFIRLLQWRNIMSRL